MITRRAFIVSFTGLLAAPLAGEGQQADRTKHLGWFAPGPIPSHLDMFREGLRALGYVEGKTFVVEERYADGRPELLASRAKELVRANVDVIVTSGTEATLAAKRVGGSIPIVFVSGRPLEAGLVPSLAHPGGTMTGLAIVALDLNAKRLEIFHEAFPKVVRLGVLYESWQRSGALPKAEAAARSLGLQLVPLEVQVPDDVERAFATAIRERVGAVMAVSSAAFNAQRDRIVSLTAKHRLPAIYEHRDFPEVGGLMSYGPDIRDAYRRAATYVDKILKGAKPADLPVEQPTKFELVINLKTAKALGLTIPQSLLLRADEVIQ